MSRSIAPAFNLKNSSKILFRSFSFSLFAQSHFQVCMALFFYHLRCSLQQWKRKHYSCLLAWNSGLYWPAAVDRFYQGRSCKVGILTRARENFLSQKLIRWSYFFNAIKICNSKSGMYVRNSKKKNRGWKFFHFGSLLYRAFLSSSLFFFFSEEKDF